MDYVVSFPKIEEAKPVGRPKGTNRPASLEIRYPIKWKPIYDLFVADVVCGLSNKEIGAKHNYSPVQVGNVLNSPLGQEKFAHLQQVINNLAGERVVSIEDMQARIKVKAYKAAEDFLDDERDLASAAPIAFIDRAIKIAALGESKAAQTNIQINNQKTLMISTSQVDNVTKALELSREVFSSEK